MTVHDDKVKLTVNNVSVEKYLAEIHQQSLQTATGVNAIPTGAHVRDDEQVLTGSFLTNLFCLAHSSYLITIF